jgi:hypothetical protein
VTLGLEGRCSIQLSYGQRRPVGEALDDTATGSVLEGSAVRFQAGRGDTIRTCDILLPKQALYRAELRPDEAAIIARGGSLTDPRGRLLRLVGLHGRCQTLGALTGKCGFVGLDHHAKQGFGARGPDQDPTA